jgi:hypothetical protein
MIFHLMRARTVQLEKLTILIRETILIQGAGTVCGIDDNKENYDKVIGKNKIS